MNPKKLIPGDKEPKPTATSSGTSRTATPSPAAEVMTGEDEDAEMLPADVMPANANFAGHWTIGQATAWVIYGNPDRALPERGAGHDNILDRAERLLTDDFQAGRVALFGRRQLSFDAERPARSALSVIPREELFGEVNLNNSMTLPTQSWLFVRDPDAHNPWHRWNDVRIPEASLRALHPTPLVAGDKAAQASGLTETVPAARLDEGVPLSLSRPTQTNPAVRGWFRDRVDTWPDEQPAPSEAVDWRAITRHFAPGLTRAEFRLVREQETPAAWRRQGRRVPWGVARRSAD